MYLLFLFLKSKCSLPLLILDLTRLPKLHKVSGVVILCIFIALVINYLISFISSLMASNFSSISDLPKDPDFNTTHNQFAHDIAANHVPEASLTLAQHLSSLAVQFPDTAAQRASNWFNEAILCWSQTVHSTKGKQKAHGFISDLMIQFLQDVAVKQLTNIGATVDLSYLSFTIQFSKDHNPFLPPENPQLLLLLLIQPMC